MSKHILNRSVSLAAATLVVGLSGCSMMNVDPDSRMGRTSTYLGDTSAKVWKRTKHVFRVTDDEEFMARLAAKNGGQVGDEFQDEVDMALMENEPLLNDDGTAVVSATSMDQDAILLPEDLTDQGTGDVLVLNDEGMLVPETTSDAQPLSNTQLTEAETSAVPLGEVDNQVALQTEDYTHIVQDNESLWVLSKSLTGDANNWRALAEINGLDANGTVYPGQSLVIPADMANGKGIVGNTAVASADVLLPTKSVATDTVAEIAIKPAKAAQKAEVAVAKVETDTTEFSVQAGETMWDLAKRTTGDATNWKIIASANGMTEKEAGFIRYGQQIGIPDALLKSAGDAPVLAAAKPVTGETVKPVVETPVVATAPRVEVPQVTTAAAAAADGENIEILPATFKSNPPKIDENQVAIADTPAAAPAADSGVSEGTADSIMVSGTYYPKAVYNDANFSSTLLMRVSPGTKLTVSRAIGPWFEVKTDRGIGYVHSRDIK